MLQKCSLWVVAAVFFRHPTTELSVAELSRQTALAATSVRLHLAELEDLAIVSRLEKKQGKRVYPVFLANHESDDFRRYKRLYNLAALHDITGFLHRATGARAIVLFGSYRYGEDIETSDIDIFLQTSKTTIDTARYERTLQRRIQLHFASDFRKVSDTLRENIINGIVLSGFLKI